MLLSTLPSEANPTGQLMLLQNRAHHEDRLIHTRHVVDTQMQDFSHIFKSKVSGKKSYLMNEKSKKIYEDNMSLLSKIYNITFDKHNEFASKYGVTSKYSKGEDSSTIGLHPFSTDHRSRSMNTAVRRKELEKISRDNMNILEKLKSMKSTIPCAKEFKQRKKQLNYLKQMVQKHDVNQPARVLNSYLAQKAARGDSVLNNYMQRHEMIRSRDLDMTHNNSSVFLNEKCNTSYDLKMIKRPEKNNKGEKRRTRSRNEALNVSEVIPRGGDSSFLEEGNRSFNGKERRRVTLEPLTRKSGQEESPVIRKNNAYNVKEIVRKSGENGGKVKDGYLIRGTEQITEDANNEESTSRVKTTAL